MPLTVNIPATNSGQKVGWANPANISTFPTNFCSTFCKMAPTLCLRLPD
jgi:hypothetical protein